MKNTDWALVLDGAPITKVWKVEDGKLFIKSEGWEPLELAEDIRPEMESWDRSQMIKYVTACVEIAFGFAPSF